MVYRKSLMISIKLFKRMYKSKKTLAVILARGGSKGLPGKNIIPLKGRPLIAWTITAALEAKLIDRVVVSSDSVDILAVAKRYGADTIKRPKKLATDQIRPELAIQHVLATLRKNESYIPELLILLQPTSPLRGFLLMRRQDLPPVFFTNGAIYLVKTLWFLKSNSLFPKRTVPYVMSEDNSQDVDTPEDLKKIEKLMALKKYGYK